MHAIQQKCRPKHQVLVLKCYPRTTKGAVDVKPNSSELSYLLFYAQSRRTKIQKVGGFLEKKTASDVYRLRIGNVQVTLQILAALIEKTPKDLPLFASSVLKILEQILKSNDITMVESALPLFETFCENHDPTSLLADQAYLHQYVSVVRQYAILASTRSYPGKAPPSKPVALRWRNCGLEAIKYIAASDALSSVAGRQYHIVVPMILENLWTDNEDFLDVLLQRAQLEEKIEGARLTRRRTSITTVRTADTGGEGNAHSHTHPLTLTATAVDEDKVAEEDIGVLAMQCLKQIFVVPNRAQIHTATLALLNFIEERVGQQEEVVRVNSNGKECGWAIKMLSLISRWAPVQDRFTILTTAMDVLAQKPLTDDTLSLHIAITAMIGALLRSDVNLIGLSVLDVLLQLATHIKRLVQMPGDPNMMRSDAPGPDSHLRTAVHVGEAADQTAAQRKELLARLERCMGDLATHVYYADQISDMILTLLLKLKPSRSSSTISSHPSEVMESPREPLQDQGQGGAPPADRHFDGLFALPIAKTAALKAIKAILLVANPRTKMSGDVGLSRNRVPVNVWNGTQWLLRDADGFVRKAYVDALMTWLDRETTPADQRIRDETMRIGAKKRDQNARRVVSAASTRPDKLPKLSRTHFLQLTHIAIYDNAIQFVDYEPDLVLLHALLAKLADKFGINAVRHGLPMIFRLQEDIQDAETPIAKVRLGSLVHGYFWVLTDKFELEGSMAGQAIHNEIIRRRSKNFWIDGVRLPLPPADLMGTPGTSKPVPRLVLEEIESEALLPFDERLPLIDGICTSYQEEKKNAGSPPSSPVTSPGRNFTHPIPASANIPAISGVELDVPSQFREQLLEEWTREDALAAALSGSKSESLSGSRTGTTGNSHHRHHSNHRLAVNGAAPPATANGYAIRDGSLAVGAAFLRPATSPAPATHLSSHHNHHSSVHIAANGKSRKSSMRSERGGPDMAEEDVGVTSVEQLKLVLSGHVQPPATATLSGLQQLSDDSSESLISYDMTPSEASYSIAPGTAFGDTTFEPTDGTTPMQKNYAPLQRPATRERKNSSSGGPLTSHPPASSSGALDLDEPIPPVPPVPSGVEGRVPQVAGGAPQLPPLQMHQQDTGGGSMNGRPMTSRRSVRSRSGRDQRALSSATSASSTSAAAWAAAVHAQQRMPAMDIQTLLKGIDSGVGQRSMGTVTRPPY